MGVCCIVFDIDGILFEFFMNFLNIEKKKKTHPAFRVLNVFYFQTDFNLHFKRKRDVSLTCTRIWCILHSTLSLTWPRRLTSHIIAQIDLTSCFKNTSFEWNKTHQTLTDHRSKCAKRGKHEMCNFGSCKTRFEFLSQFRKVRNAFQCFVTQVQTRLPKSKCVWPMMINVICTVFPTLKKKLM